MKNKSFLIFGVFLFILGCGVFAEHTLKNIKKKGYIILSTNAEFEPFEYKDGNEFVGIDIDISREIAKKLNVNLKIEDVSYDALPLELSRNTCDFVMAAMSKTEEKARNMDFSEYYFRAKQFVIVQENSEIKNSKDLKWKRIGVNLGSTGDIYCTENLVDSKIIRYDDSTDAVLDLLNKRIQAVVVDNLPAFKLVKKNKGTKILDEYLFEEEYRIAVPKGATEVLEFINNSIKELKFEGKIDEIILKYSNDDTEINSDLSTKIYNNLIFKDRYIGILKGLFVTIEIAVFAIILGTLIGIVICIIKIMNDKNILVKILKFLADFYVMFIRGTPMVIQLFIIYYLILSSTGLNKVIIAILSFGVNSGAYVSEIIRSGILSIDKGQFEAGRSLGLSETIVMKKIIFPQAFKNIIPTLCNEFIQLVKETSVAGFIGVVDLSKSGDTIRSQTYEPFVPLVTVALIYFCIVMLITRFMSNLERRFHKNDSN
ncbi:MAG: glutamine ABC transporter permease [Candidatus Paraimprobicoccus trichonymphae]|uniref:Glutamine ABC transporter permease n=1 Tax=Candidatus Paraimprobicoccus trichonymphae TaxID=3033793 RepID=A0AA48I4Z1_9FIRM|nr:MAG: glutamine ABC transporter permease [Candidatus Paraimprobicoccus trichonymphae]